MLCLQVQPFVSQESALKEVMIRRKPVSERKRPADEAVAYAVGNGTRIDALAILAEGEHSSSQIAKILGVDTQLVNNHIRELFACGCIEPTKTVKVRNATQRFYRALARPHISDGAYEEMPVEARREVISVLIQAVLAETLASLRAGKMEADDDLALMWDCVRVDKEGRRKISAEIQAHFDRILEIQDESASRIAESGESPITTVVSLSAFERSRPGLPENLVEDPPETS
jgi:DNA-binding transcriptional ArsR family regulator